MFQKPVLEQPYLLQEQSFFIFYPIFEFKAGRLFKFFPRTSWSLLF